MAWARGAAGTGGPGESDTRGRGAEPTSGVGCTRGVARTVPAVPLALRLLAWLRPRLIRRSLVTEHNSALPLEGRSRAELEAIVEEQREKARAEGRSKRILLSAIYEQYTFPGSKRRFIRAHALEDIQEAERRLRSNACRCVAHACDGYFAATMRNVADESRERQAAERRARA